MTRWSVIGAPVDCLGADASSLEPFGTELSPAALRDLDMVGRIGGVDRGDLDVRVVGPERDPATGLVGGTTVHDTVRKVRSGVAELRASGERVLLLGGCCIPLMGALAGARDAHPGVGLVYIDGHLDLYDHLTSPTGEAADMPTAAVLGIGEPGLLEAMGAPVLGPERLAVVGPRDSDEPATVGHLVDQLGLAVHPPERVLADPAGVARESIDRAATDGAYWVHLDVDVFDEREFPATDYLMPGGLTLAAGRDLLQALGADDRLVGMSVGCYNPDKDADRRCGAALVDLVVAAVS